MSVMINVRDVILDVDVQTLHPYDVAVARPRVRTDVYHCQLTPHHQVILEIERGVTD